MKIAVEYDGRQHAERAAQWEHDLDRREVFDRRGWRFVIVRSAGIYNEPERTLVRVLATPRERNATGLPAVLSDEWRRHFPLAQG